MKKNFYYLLSGLLFLAGMGQISKGQSLVVSGTQFIYPDSVSFTYESPDFDSLDWIGIYHVEDSPEDVGSLLWSYISTPTGTLHLKNPGVTGTYKAFLFCCDGYDTIAMSSEFQVVAPMLTSSRTSYFKGDSIVFSYVSPRFSPTDWIGLYPTGTKPGVANPSIDYQYIPDSAGTITFKTVLDAGTYDAYLLCCDVYDSLAAFTFNIIDPDVATVAPVTQQFTAGEPIVISYNDPQYATDDWIGLYFEGDDPALVSSVAWTTVTSKTDTVTFPGTLAGGSYFAVLYCCGGTDTEYDRSDAFTVLAGAVGTYVKTNASAFPVGANVIANFRDKDWEDKDWVGIYPKGETPDGDPESTVWQYAVSDSGTIDFGDTLEAGDWVVYLLCCDGYNIKAKYDFKVSNEAASVVASSFTYATTDSLVFSYNSPDFTDKDWIGIYHPGDIPGDVGSIIWQYIPTASGKVVFNDHNLPAGEYWAGLLCCDIWDLYAQTSFIISGSLPNTINPVKDADRLMVFPNPTSGLVTIRSTAEDKLRQIKVFSLTGSLVYQEKLDGSITERTIDLKSLNKGAFFLEIQTGNFKVTKKLIIQ